MENYKVTPEEVTALRAQTKVGINEAKTALIHTFGHMDLAVKFVNGQKATSAREALLREADKQAAKRFYFIERDQRHLWIALAIATVLGVIF